MKQSQHITPSLKHDCQASETPLYTKNPIFCPNRATTAEPWPNPYSLVRFAWNHFKHILNITPKLSKPLLCNCNLVCTLHHFHFEALQVEFYKKIQASSRQAKNWERLRELQASSKELQASLKVATLPYPNSTKQGICQSSISLFRHP